MFFAKENGRYMIGQPDVTFGPSNRAKERIAQIGKENVINSTIGVLMDDEGKLAVLSSVVDCIKSLSNEEYAAYAPVLGTSDYIKAVKRAVFLDDEPKDVFIEGCYTPGGTGALHCAMSAYTNPGDKILVHDWMWGAYKTIAGEMGRSIDTYEMFDADDKFNAESFEEGLDRLFKTQDTVVVVFNTPANNPTGYAFSREDWAKVLKICEKKKGKKVVILCDIAYIDYAGKGGDRGFLTDLASAPENVLPLIAWTASKCFTMYGMRCGAMLCMTRDEKVSKEFLDVMQVICRGTWSNGNHSAMAVATKILLNDELKAKVDKEREGFKEMLARRGEILMKSFEETGLRVAPYKGGFYALVPCKQAKEVCAKLEEKNVFLVAMGEGIRICVASSVEEECRIIPGKIKEAFDELGLK